LYSDVIAKINVPVTAAVTTTRTMTERHEAVIPELRPARPSGSPR
jgi:hypothetical protein